MMTKLELRPRWRAAQVITAFLVCASSALAQQELILDNPANPTQATSSWFSLPVRAGIFVALLIVTYAFGFYAAFPWLLDRKKAMRPLAAYGLVAGLIWVSWCGSAFLVFQDLLVLGSINNDVPLAPFLKDWVLTCVICLAALIGFALLRMVFGGRSAAAES